MPLSRSGVDFCFAPPLTEDWNGTQQTNTLILTCDWVSRFVLMKDLLGYSYVDLGSQSLVRVLPMNHPEAPLLYCSAARLAEGKGVLQEVAGGVPAFRYWQDGLLTRDGKAWITASFQSTMYDVKDAGDIEGEWERFTIRRLRRSAEAQRTQGNGWRWAGTGAPNAPPNDKEQVLQTDVNLPYTLTNIEWLWLGLPDRPPNMLNCANRINSFTFQEFGAETLLFSPPQEEPVQLPNLRRGYNITFSAVHRPSGWNDFWRVQDPISGTNRGAGFYPVESRKANGAGEHRKPFLSYEFRKCWSYVLDETFQAGF